MSWKYSQLGKVHTRLRALLARSLRHSTSNLMPTGILLGTFGPLGRRRNCLEMLHQLSPSTYPLHNCCKLTFLLNLRSGLRYSHGRPSMMLRLHTFPGYRVSK